MNNKKLVQKAIGAKKYSHSPYSKFRVGAALLTNAGKIFTGCNIENSSYSLTICAERTAIFKAISDGHTKFKAIAIASDSKDLISPCGACRQVLYDLADDLQVILINGEGKTKIMQLRSLLPLPFESKHLKQR
jgi:cytidine deaminase